VSTGEDELRGEKPSFYGERMPRPAGKARGEQPEKGRPTLLPINPARRMPREPHASQVRRSTRPCIRNGSGE
jgi:hypothetical protein